MARKLEYKANDTKFGMSLTELKTAVDEAIALASINETNTDLSKVTVLINWGGSVKTLWVEV